MSAMLDTTAQLRHQPTYGQVPWDEAADAPLSSAELDRWCAEHSQACEVCHDLFFVEPADGYGHG